MKFAMGLIAIMILGAGLYVARINMAEKYTANRLRTIETHNVKQVEIRKEEAQKQYMAEKITVSVKAKDVHECMKILDTKVLNNDVVECTKNHTVLMTRSEAENFKE